jgi:hypothetical protein
VEEDEDEDEDEDDEADDLYVRSGCSFFPMMQTGAAAILALK